LKIGSSTPVKPTEKKEEKKEEKKDIAPSKPQPVEAQKAPEPKEAKEPPKKSASNTPSKPSSAQNSRPPSISGDEPSVESRDADAVIKEQEEELDESLVHDMYGKEHVNVVFIGHVDAGKSTLGGNILFLTGMVDERTMEKYEKEAKEAGRESWYLSWALDSTKEERNKGKTVEVGRARFETEKRRYTILDAPGHKSYVPNMISGAAQADVGVLVISARKGEYETGFDKGGQTREHAVLAKMQGINKLIIVINKMDDPTVEWSKERYVYI
jgi:peptide chain release factor subunit 3